MVPPITHPIWVQVITGKREVTTSNVGLNMLIANLRLSYRQDPSEASVRSLVLRMHEFFKKYGSYYQHELEQVLKGGAHA